jgi:HPt (histidine-containing phosphotransfer) domain-containing protein
MANLAHSLKSSSANVGAAVLSRYCAEMETYARRGETEEARRCAAKIETEHRSVQGALVSEIETLAASNA